MLGAILGAVALTLVASLVVFIILIIAPLCLIFQKAGVSWWKALVPFYNVYVLNEICRLPWWMFILYFVPFANIFAMVATAYYLSLSFGRGPAFAVGLIFVPFIFYPILGYGSSAYTPLSYTPFSGGSSAPSAAPSSQTVSQAQVTTSEQAAPQGSTQPQGEQLAAQQAHQA